MLEENRWLEQTQSGQFANMKGERKETLRRMLKIGADPGGCSYVTVCVTGIGMYMFQLLRLNPCLYIVSND